MEPTQIPPLDPDSDIDNTGGSLSSIALIFCEKELPTLSKQTMLTTTAECDWVKEFEVIETEDIFTEVVELDMLYCKF